MSDFDEEAERERLREQFERDREKREASERMSELLLKGATMTNAHCETCGDPIFRYEGQEFCPTCQQPVGGDAAAAEGSPDAEPTTDAEPATDAPGGAAGGDADAGGEAGAGAPADAADRAAGSADATPGAAGGADESTRTHPEAEDAQADGIDGPEVPSADPNPEGTTAEPDPAPGPSPQRADPSPAHAGRPTGDAGQGPDLDAATASLARTLARMARAAEETDDLARKREYLGAASEAAEALAAARRAR